MDLKLGRNSNGNSNKNENEKGKVKLNKKNDCNKTCGFRSKDFPEIYAEIGNVNNLFTQVFEIESAEEMIP